MPNRLGPIRSAGVAGLGRMGLPIALRLIEAGFEVHGFDLDDRAMQALAAAGGVPGADPAALGQCDVSITLLPSIAATKEVLFARTGLLSAARPEHVHILMGTFGPDLVAEVVKQAESSRGVIVDCPVSGSVDHARSGSLTAIVGTDDITFGRIGLVLAPLCTRTFLVGKAGQAAAMKVVVNTIVGSVNHALAEALVLAEAEGLDLDAAYDVFEASVIASPYVSYKRKHIFQHLLPADGTIRQITKDLDLALELAARNAVLLPQVQLARDTLLAAGLQGSDEHDLGQVFDHLRSDRRLKVSTLSTSDK